MPKSTSFSTEILQLIFNGTTLPNFADNTTSTSANTQLFLSLHTANPGIGGSQTASETSYTNYTRVGVQRQSSGWTVSGNGVAFNTSLIQFPQCGASGATITYVAAGTLFSGTGLVLYEGPLNSSLAVANLIQPQFTSQSLQIVEQ